MTEAFAIPQAGRIILCFLLCTIAIHWSGLARPAYANKKESSSSTQTLGETLDDNVTRAKKGKQEFEQFLRKRFQELEEKAQALRERGTVLHESARAKMNEKIENLKEKKEAIYLQIEKLRNQGENAWKDVQARILKTLKDLEHSLSDSSRER